MKEISMIDQQGTQIYEADAAHLRVVIIQHGSQLSMFFRDPTTGQLDGPMSRIDHTRPLHLLAEYTQVMLLSLLWRPEPERIAILGFGGGRIAMLLQHHFPQVEIVGVDIDALFYQLAQEYFMLQERPGLRYVVGDARQVVATDRGVFDCIIMDAFSDGRDNLNHLATVEFYRLVRKHLHQAGIMCVNLLRSDPLFTEKAYTFIRSFRHSAVLSLKHSLMLFGSDGWALRQPDAIQRASELQNRHGFDVPLESHAARLQRSRDSELAALFRRQRPVLLHDR